MASAAPSLRSRLSLSVIAQVLEEYNAASVLLRSEVQREPVFDLDEIHLWLGWAGRTRTLVLSRHLPRQVPLLRSTGVPVPLSFLLQEVSSITAHLYFSLTRIHDTSGMLFLSERLCLWRPAYEPLPERMYERSLLLDETIEMFTDVNRELFQRARHYLSLLHAHSGALPRRTLVFGELDECLMRLAGWLFGDWPAEDVEGSVKPAPVYEGWCHVDAPRD
ncbi:hypothetical protein CERSUDRAFT_92229 [Gelatoporia subvermispora B]|uniref:Uncharacterized protein n=1 Tax=Ceriporiopsis subvermispora (strain B) TaxID=914234 RepID=M2RMN8_CERS8|nr:hypothetical protein CERSUDRAFT_92229 [Gelatoporia subvermispora B]